MSFEFTLQPSATRIYRPCYIKLSLPTHLIGLAALGLFTIPCERELWIANNPIFPIKYTNGLPHSQFNKEWKDITLPVVNHFDDIFRSMWSSENETLCFSQVRLEPSAVNTLLQTALIKAAQPGNYIPCTITFSLNTEMQLRVFAEVMRMRQHAGFNIYNNAPKSLTKFFINPESIIPTLGLLFQNVQEEKLFFDKVDLILNTEL